MQAIVSRDRELFGPTLLKPESDGFGEAAETCTRAACAPQKIVAMAAYRPTGDATAA